MSAFIGSTVMLIAVIKENQQKYRSDIQESAQLTERLLETAEKLLQQRDQLHQLVKEQDLNHQKLVAELKELKSLLFKCLEEMETATSGTLTLTMRKQHNF